MFIITQRFALWVACMLGDGGFGTTLYCVCLYRKPVSEYAVLNLHYELEFVVGFQGDRKIPGCCVTVLVQAGRDRENPDTNSVCACELDSTHRPYMEDQSKIACHMIQTPSPPCLKKKTMKSCYLHMKGRTWNSISRTDCNPPRARSISQTKYLPALVQLADAHAALERQCCCAKDSKPSVWFSDDIEKKVLMRRVDKQMQSSQRDRDPHVSLREQRPHVG